MSAFSFLLGGIHYQTFASLIHIWWLDIQSRMPLPIDQFAKHSWMLHCPFRLEVWSIQVSLNNGWNLSSSVTCLISSMFPQIEYVLILVFICRRHKCCVSNFRCLLTFFHCLTSYLLFDSCRPSTIKMNFAIFLHMPFFFPQKTWKNYTAISLDLNQWEPGKNPKLSDISWSDRMKKKSRDLLMWPFPFQSCISSERE